jgi:hypothetical protein
VYVNQYQNNQYIPWFLTFVLIILLQKSFINGSLDEQNTFTLDFGMEEADSLRLYVKPRTGGTVPPSLFNVEIKVCYIPGKYLNNRYIFMSPGEHLMLTLGNPLILSVFTTYFSLYTISFWCFVRCHQKNI